MNHEPRRTLLPQPALALLVALAIPVAAPSLLAQKGDERKAIDAFANAQKLVDRGKYVQLVATYKEIARRWGHTGAGLLASMRTQPTAFLGHADVERSGPAANRVDVVVMGDGYRLQDQNEFDEVAGVIPKLFRKHKLLGEYYTYHNFIRANLRSKDQGVSGYGRKEDTALGGHISGTVQNQVGVNGGLVRKWLKEVPDNDGLVIAIVKAGSMGTGSKGIAAIGGRADDTVIHEWGHAFADLADEYTSFTGHRGRASNSANISISKDPKQAPWYHWIEAKAPGVGMYRGGDGRIKGVWRPTASGCAMQGGVIFCPVCREVFVKEIYRYVDPIDWSSPDPRDKEQRWSKTKENGIEKPLKGPGPFEFKVRTMEPKTHGIEVRWYVLSGNELIKPVSPGPWKDRNKRGPLAHIDAKPKSSHSGRGRHKHLFKISKGELQPGTYQVVLRVQDKAKPSGQSMPWVLKDERQLLWSERVWKLEVTGD